MNIVTRAELGLPAPTRPPMRIRPGLRKGVVLHWNGPPMGLDPANPSPRNERRLVKAIVDHHRRSRGWSDGAYSWIVGDEAVYEIRGEMSDQFANGQDVVGVDEGDDTAWYSAMAMIGQGESLSARMESNLLDLVDHIRKLGAGMRVLPHSDFRNKACPGDEIRAMARRLDNRPTSLTPKPVELGSVPLRAWAPRFLDTEHALASTYSPVVEMWQRMLRHNGFNAGPIDGKAGAKTEQANRRFMRSVGLSPQPRPSSRAWNMLLRSVTVDH